MQRLTTEFRATRRAQVGFTMVELMAVVMIVGILALIATYSIRKYIASSKTSEATEMIGSIKAAEEAYKDETFTYLNVTNDINTFYPTNSKPGQIKVQWGGTGTGQTGFQQLGVSAAAPVLFVYACTAGAAGTAPPAPGGSAADITVGNWPSATSSVPWYVVKAKADLDGDGRYTVFVGSSFTGDIFAANN